MKTNKMQELLSLLFPPGHSQVSAAPFPPICQFLLCVHIHLLSSD
jgi:hypothetical protein